MFKTLGTRLLIGLTPLLAIMVGLGLWAIVRSFGCISEMMVSQHSARTTPRNGRSYAANCQAALLRSAASLAKLRSVCLDQVIDKVDQLVDVKRLAQICVRSHVACELSGVG